MPRFRVDDQSFAFKLSVYDLSVDRDRGTASCVESGQNLAFATYRHGCWGVVYRSKKLSQAVIVASPFKSQGALPWSRQHE